MFADQGYRRDELADYLKQTEAPYRLEIVQKKEGQKGFQVLAQRGIVERTNSWRRAAR
jgi:hypothetical protein